MKTATRIFGTRRILLAATMLVAFVVAPPPTARAGCVASYGPTDGSELRSCSYTAGGPGVYAGFLNAGVFEISVDGQVAVSSSGDFAPAGKFSAAPGQTVTVTVQCDRGVYCTAYAAAGAVAANDEPAAAVATPAASGARMRSITLLGHEWSNFAVVICLIDAVGAVSTRVDYCELRDHVTGFQDSVGAGTLTSGPLAAATTVGYDYAGLFYEVCMAGFVDWGTSVESLTERCWSL